MAGGGTVKRAPSARHKTGAFPGAVKQSERINLPVPAAASMPLPRASYCPMFMSPGAKVMTGRPWPVSTWSIFSKKY